jgi:hypothetical protein
VPNPVDLFGAISGFAKLTMLVAVAAFGLAVAYVVRPSEQKLVLMRPVSLSAIFATLSGLLSGWMAVLTGIAATPDGRLPLSRVYMGIAETLTVGFVCFGLLAAAWLLVAVGMLRRVNVAGSPS